MITSYCLMIKGITLYSLLC